MVDVPAEAADVARRYLRVERLATGAVAVSLGLLGGVAVIALPLLWGLAAALGLLALARVPLFRTGVDARLQTDAEFESVYESFTGATPPPLAFQWGIADEVREEGDTAVYEVDYFFGLRSIELRVEREVTETGDDRRVDLIVTENGGPWGTYTATISEAADGTEVVLDVTSDRRFGLHRLPQMLVARHYREATLRAQGYDVLERDGSFTVSR